MVEEMSEREEVYVCKRCGYVLRKRDAVISGWDAKVFQLMFTVRDAEKS